MKCIDIQVLLLVISLAKCLAMSIDELQDFSNFLKETSLLDQPLKKNPSDEDDDDVPISDHAWEESGRFEGDLILNDRQRQLIVQNIAEGLSRNGLKDSTKRWPNNEVIFYIQKEHFTGDQVQAILRGIEDLSQAACVKFRPYRKGDRDAVVVQGSRRGCFSQVGYQGGYQVLNLSGRHPVGRGCFRHGTVVHEFLHTLGFYHMQSSPDRDDYIDVVWENIVQPARHNFRKYNLFSVSDFGVGYDYDSVLHYSRKAFSSNGGDTLVPKKSGVDIGQRIGLSDKDTAKLNKMYCDADSNNFEAADDVSHTPVIKKKKTPKNKPFEGQGIGYHQGKTVVFKLPATETYRVPESPANHVFDYFSKAPQVMSPPLIEGFGLGKEITYSYDLPAGYQIVEHNFPMYTSLFNKTDRGVDFIISHDNTQSKNDEIKPFTLDSSNKSKEIIEDFNKKEITMDKSKYTPNTNINVHADAYKPNTDYSAFYNPVNDYKVGTKTDNYLNYSPPSTGNNDHTAIKETNLKLTRQFIEKLRQPKSSNNSTNSVNSNKEDRLLLDEFNLNRETSEKPKAFTKEESILDDLDVSFRKSYPYTKLEEIKNIYSLRPEYFSKKYLENRHDFSNIYNPSDYLNRDHRNIIKNSQYTLFGDPVPIKVNYVPRINSESAETKDTHNRNNNVNEQIKVEDGTAEKHYSYEDYEPYDSTEKSNNPQSASNEEDSKSYEVTEKNKDQIEIVTEKPEPENSPSHDAEYSLEKRLPEIFERYVNYDNYDITSPYVSS